MISFTGKPSELYDITIIGAGPTGMYAAYYAGLRGMKTLLVDSLPELGGQLTALYPEKYIFDVAGFPQILAKDLSASLARQMMQYHPTVALDEKITRLAAGEGITTLETEGGNVYQSKAVLLAAGVGAFTPRKLEAPGVAELEERGVFYAVKNPGQFAGKRLLIVGGGDSAFDWSIHLSELAACVVQIHRTDKFRAHEDTVAKVKSLPVVLKTFHEVKEIRQGECALEVTLFDNRTKEECTVVCDAVLLNLGFLTSLGPIKDWGFETEGNAVKVSSRMETNLPGVYAAGDIAGYQGKLKLIVTGFAEAAIAVNHAKAYVDPNAKVFPGHTSESTPQK